MAIKFYDYSKLDMLLLNYPCHPLYMYYCSEKIFYVYTIKLTAVFY